MKIDQHTFKLKKKASFHFSKHAMFRRNLKCLKVSKKNKHVCIIKTAFLQRKSLFMSVICNLHNFLNFFLYLRTYFTFSLTLQD